MESPRRQAVNEINSLMKDIKWLEEQMPVAISNWKADMKVRYPGGCQDLVLNFPATAHRRNVIKKICQSPGTYKRDFFESLYNWLEKYKRNRQGTLAFTTKSLDNFVRRGIVLIHNFVVLTTYFADQSEFFAPLLPSTSANITMNKELYAKQKQYKEYIYRLNQRLIGCSDRAIFPFLRLSGSVQTLVTDLLDMRDYLAQQCLRIRAELLRL